MLKQTSLKNIKLKKATFIKKATKLISSTKNCIFVGSSILLIHKRVNQEKEKEK